MPEHSRFMAGARLQGAAMIAVLAVGFGLGVATFFQPGPQRQLNAALTPSAFLAGQTAAAVNHAMAHDLPFGPALSTAGGILRWRVFGSGGPQVNVGCNGWLYLTEEMRPWPGSQQSMQRRAEATHRIAASLAKQGIGLVIALVPDKARVETAGGCGVPYSAESRARLADFSAMLAGLPVVNLYDSYRGVDHPLYYRTDTHWNQAGAGLAAQRIAAAVTAEIDRSHHFTTTEGTPTDRAGDLLRLMSLENVSDHLPIKLRPLPDRERPQTTVETDAPAEGGSLLDDGPVAQVVLIGSSYSVNANFLGQLEQALGAPVGQFAQAGGAFWGSAKDYFASPAFHETPPKLVIWEIPERVVNQPIGPEEAAFLDGWKAD